MDSEGILPAIEFNTCYWQFLRTNYMIDWLLCCLLPSTNPWDLQIDCWTGDVKFWFFIRCDEGCLRPRVQQGQTSMSFLLHHLCQRLLLTESQRDHWILHHSSHHFAARLDDQSAVMCDAPVASAAAELRWTVSTECRPRQFMHSLSFLTTAVFSRVPNCL